MGVTLDESEIQSLHELLDVVFATRSEDEAVSEALISLKTMIGTHIPTNIAQFEMALTCSMAELDEPMADDDDGDKEDTGATNRIAAMKQHILATKPNFFEYLLKLPEGKNGDEVDTGLPESKFDVIIEMLRQFPAAKLAFIPHIDQLLRSTFREDPDANYALRVRDSMVQCSVAELLCPDAAAGDANKATQEALSKHIQLFTEILSPYFQAGGMTEALTNKQRALAYGLVNITKAPLNPNAVPAFIQAGGLDALLVIVHRGPLSVPDMESPNASLEDACDALSTLMGDSACDELAQALVERQAISPLLKQTSYICGLQGMYSAPRVPRTLVTISKFNETLRQQVTAEAKWMVKSDGKGCGSGAAIVLWNMLQAAEEVEVEGILGISKSKEYVSFFLADCKLGASDEVLDAVGDALAARVTQPGDQLRKGISTPEQVERLVVLVEYACLQSAPDISSAIQVLRELVLPTDPEATGGFFDPDEDLKRVDKKFCKTFGKAIKTRYDAARALAPKYAVDGEVQEPSEEGLVNMKNVKTLSVIVDEQYSAMALLAEGLLDYLQYLIFHQSSPLSRRAGLELLAALTHDSSLSSDYAHVPDVIDAFEMPVVLLLDDPRALIRALAMQWLVKIMSYRHPKGQELNRYKPAIDFVMESVTEEKLLEMLRGTENEAQVAAMMVEAMAQHSTDPEVQERLKKNQELVEALWNGVFWDGEKVSQVWCAYMQLSHGSHSQDAEDKDEDISEDVFIYGNIQPSSGEALTAILDPFIDRTSIVAHITPHIAQAGEKVPSEFADFLTNMPGVASLAILASETGVLSTIGKMISNEEQLPFAVSALRHLAQGIMLAKLSLGQSDDVYPALVKVLREGEESTKNTILYDLESLLYGSTVSKMKFVKSGGIQPLLEIIALDDEDISRKAMSSLISLVTDFPEGAKAAIDAGAITVLEAKEDPNDIFERKTNALNLLESLGDTLAVDRIKFTPEAYAAFGKNLSDPGAMERLVQNLKSSMDEKQLAIAGGLLAVFADMLQSSSNTLLVLEALYEIYVADGVILSGHNVAARVGERCGLPEALEPLTRSEDGAIKEYATRVRGAIVIERNDELEGDAGEEQEENAEDHAEDESEKENDD
ncbi:hypothetical protein FRC10_003711 [Ceratobasidium sp. 414]|nr:hypothetical protein FRC10_003711 [Ceratobasidium sp. 414]